MTVVITTQSFQDFWKLQVQTGQLIEEKDGNSLVEFTAVYPKVDKHGKDITTYFVWRWWLQDAAIASKGET